jgi:hypothetical protein
MKKKVTLIVGVSLIFDGILIFPNVALAYIDPNTGNIIFQILFPILTVITTSYLLCKNFIRRKIYYFKEWINSKIKG